ARRRAPPRLRRGPRADGGGAAPPLRGGAADRRRARRAHGRRVRRADDGRARGPAGRPAGGGGRARGAAASRAARPRRPGKGPVQRRRGAQGRPGHGAPPGPRVRGPRALEPRLPAHLAHGRDDGLRSVAPAALDHRPRHRALPLRAPRPADHRGAPRRPRLLAHPRRRHPAAGAGRGAGAGAPVVHRAGRL
ncbi:MAG: hypothetical protein AVDCRST_MAG30-149, partial [uncultured Solirubrobacteraceae bacterium]